MLDTSPSDRSRRHIRIRAREIAKNLHSSSDQLDIGAIAHGSVDVFRDDKAKATPREGEVDARGAHDIGRDAVGLEVLRDELLRSGLAHSHVVVTKLDPDGADVRVRLLFEVDAHTADVDVGSLQGE